MCGAYLRQRTVTDYEVMVTAEGRVSHYRDIVVQAPWQNVTLDVSAVETVRDLVGRTAIAIWNFEQVFHLVPVEVGNAPGANLPGRAELFEGCYLAGKFLGGHGRMQQVQIEIARSQTGEAGGASAGDAISGYFVGLNLGDEVYAVAALGNHMTQELLRAAVAVIS